MNIDLNNVYKKDINIDTTIDYEYDDYEHSSIKKLDPVVLLGKISLNGLDEITINLHIKGAMYLEDAISLELVKKDFNLDVNEVIDEADEYFSINNNIMDLKEFVWKNIVLEIPIRVTKDEKDKEIQGDGWSLNSKKEETNAFEKLNELFEK